MMRTLVAILLTACMQAAAQPRNTLGVTYQPFDRGVGLVYERLWDIDTVWVGGDTRGEGVPQRFARMGVYGAFSYGNYLLSNITIRDHYRYEIGASWAIWPWRPEDNIFTYFTAGLVYHTFGERHYELYAFNDYALAPISATVGVGNRFGIGRRAGVVFGVRYDPFKQESCIDLRCLF